ncbi:hypothetical protein Kpol_1035p10 [Vanderwaltozyma polyspora DSM 70294]|uniref:Putative lipoate-protein ligase A n=1 Tax=Vanderwaltozyma polyspora (strain ATCC 22028 / DSM 70294 / BCRC 21397 / CBS 2163 / NBRC 10782 / NRRL Y-8283 / UCD 57-17) TaxID=436907 RepID=A7TKH6_VANPO|nr:uncharacterized protein Kpol_1035p10 [Vanderwaltozyma polyspora DSM 70294]EDO17198.1 hypothetical protein Kpol_1035p10 [Vanderwaltozyma polyspora DSM 70294]
MVMKMNTRTFIDRWLYIEIGRVIGVNMSMCVGIRRLSLVRCRRFSSKPISQSVKSLDDECESLNTMYSDMFTVPGTSKDGISESGSVDELDELNSELNSLYHVGFQVLDSKDLEEMVKSKGRFIIRSLSNDPYYNLALEDYVFRNTPIAVDHESFHSQRLMFYVNDKCAVIGKNQNIWKELYVKELNNNGYDIIRRFSGGGAVIHDLGNVNYSYLTSRDEFKREFFNEKIVHWLLGIDPNLSISLNERGDITYNGYKVSGSAFKIAKGKSYHHGTMLINSELEKFTGLLKPKSTPGIQWKCNSVDSVRSKVANIPLSGTNAFIDICADGFRSHFTKNETSIFYCNESSSINQEIIETMEKLKSHHWKFNNTPSFAIDILNGRYSLEVDKGTITKSNPSHLIGLSFNEFVDHVSKEIDPSILRSLQ